jgi:hypothetical protein
MLGFLAMALASLMWEPFGRFGMSRLLLPGLFFAVLPATHALMATLDGVRRRVGWWAVPGLVGAGAAALFVATPPNARRAWLRPWEPAPPLALGLSEDRRAVIDTLRERTTDKARILWEDRTGPPSASRWTALLPLLTERALIGGLDPDAVIEHTATGLCDHALAGRSLDEWTDDELQTYFDRYNVGWVVCWSKETAQRFDGRPFAATAAALRDGPQAGVLFSLNRQPRFVLTGSAQWLRADAQCVALGDVRPVNGQVMLSLHYQEGMRVTPSSVRIERAETLDDRIDFVRLVVPDPHVARVTITWEKH